MGWWQQLQSGKYRKSKLKLANNSWVSWVIGCPPNLKTSPKTSSSPDTKSPLPKNLPKYRFIAEYRALFNANNQLKPSLPNTIREPKRTIIKIQNMLNEGYEANKLQELLSSALSELREIYKTNKSIFSNNDRVFLKTASDINNSLTILIKTKEELVQQINQFRKQYPIS